MDRNLDSSEVNLSLATTCISGEDELYEQDVTASFVGGRLGATEA